MTTRTKTKNAAKPVVLVFCRAYLVDDFRANLASFEQAYDFRYLCDGRKPGTDDTRARFYDNMRSSKRFTLLSEAERADVLIRCRLLRNIAREKAERLIDAMGSALLSWFEDIRPSAVLCHMVDEYVIHLLSIIARKHGVIFAGYAGSFFPDRIQITRFSGGEPYDVREPTEDEVTAAVADITRKNFRQNYNQKNVYDRGQHARAMLRYQVKRAVFALKGVLESDPENLHYRVTPYIVERRNWKDFPTPEVFHADWREKLEAAGKPALYLPLGYFPESTIDYWVRDTRIIDYEALTLKMAEVLGRDFTVLVKEHPHMLGARPAAFYRSLCAIPGVLHVPTTEFSPEVLALARAAILGAGSVGVEAALRGVPVFSYSETSYWFAPSGAFFLDLGAIESWPGQITRDLETFQPMDEAGGRALIAQCLRSTVRRRGFGKRWPLCNEEDLGVMLKKMVADQTAPPA
jgi:hypothetical protein